MAFTISHELTSDVSPQRTERSVAAVSAPFLRARSGPLHRLTGIQVLATGSYVPEPVVRNEDLARLGCDADWIFQRTGISQRRQAAAGEATSDLAYQAARRCLQQAQLPAEQVDLLIVATTTPDQPMPATSCLVQHRLGTRGPAFDMNAACAGFMYALATAAQFVQTGAARRALVVGADVMTRTLNPADKKTFPLFGDGAGAVLLGRGAQEQGLLSYCLGSDGGGSQLLCIPAGGSREPLSTESLQANRQYMQMEGRAVFKWAVRMVAESLVEVLRGAQLAPEQVDAVVLHQANIRIIDSAVSDLGIDRQKVLVNLNRYGNTSAGSMPLVLDEGVRARRIRRGDNVLLCGFGAGLVWGAGVMGW